MSHGLDVAIPKLMRNYKTFKRLPPGILEKHPVAISHKAAKFSSDPDILIRRDSPGKGFHHFLNRIIIYKFLEMLPEYPLILKGVEYILLAKGEYGCDGWYDGRVIAINAWEKDQWRYVPSDYYEDHRMILVRLGVETVKQGLFYLCKFNPVTIRAFQLLHVFLHEMGHHYDKMTTRSQKNVSRGEHFAENYAYRNEDLIWRKYAENFTI